MRTRPTSIGNLLLGQTRGRVLALLYGQPEEAYFARQIARHADTSVGAVQRELALLTGAGLITKSAVGRHIFYRANPVNPVFSELRDLVAKTTGVFKLLADALEPLSSRIETAFVYGSVAAHNDTATS